MGIETPSGEALQKVFSVLTCHQFRYDKQLGNARAAHAALRCQEQATSAETLEAQRSGDPDQGTVCQFCGRGGKDCAGPAGLGLDGDHGCTDLHGRRSGSASGGVTMLLTGFCRSCRQLWAPRGQRVTSLLKICSPQATCSYVRNQANRHLLFLAAQFA